MACVYEAFDPDINRTLAVKILHKQHSADPEYRFRFLREAKAAGGLSHPNIVTIYDVGEVEERPYLAMERLEGSTLEDILFTKHVLPVQAVIRIGIQLAEALDYAHDHGIVHRDIKPSNVICLNDGDEIKITDFGIAHLEDSSGSERTRLGSVLGTPQYMSPEQVNGMAVDGRSDLFSVGVMLYQMLSGQRPFSGDTLPKVIINIVSEEHEPLKNLVSDTPPALDKVVDKLLQKEPDKRFQSGQELADALYRILQDLREREQREKEPRIISIRTKWTFLMAAIVSATMIIGLSFAYKKEVEAMTRLAIDYGRSMAKFIAMESAEPILIQDWITIEVFVRETQRNQELTDITIVDHQAIVRGSTDMDLVGKVYQKPQDETPLAETDGTRVYQRIARDQSEAFYIDTPIVFQDKEIGRVYLELPTSSLQEVANLTIVLMLVLMLATVAAVVIVGYGLSHRLTRLLRVLKRGLLEIQQRHYEHRIDEKRNDEFGQLFRSFNDMAEGLQKIVENETVIAPEAVSIEPGGLSDSSQAMDHSSPAGDKSTGNGSNSTEETKSSVLTSESEEAKPVGHSKADQENVSADLESSEQAGDEGDRTRITP